MSYLYSQMAVNVTRGLVDSGEMENLLPGFIAWGFPRSSVYVHSLNLYR